MASIYRQENEYFHQIREYSIAYCVYVDNGGTISTFTDNMVDNIIDIAMKLKASRDYIDTCLGREIIKYDKEGNRKQKNIRSQVSEGTHKASKVRSEREYGQRYNSVPRA